MRICGVEISSHDANLAVLDVDTDTEAWQMVDVKRPKIHMADGFDTEEVRRVAAEVRTFLLEHGVTIVAVKKQGAGGKFAAGPTAHRLATLFQVASDAQVVFVTPQQVAKRANGLELPNTIRKYQIEAVCAALVAARNT